MAHQHGPMAAFMAQHDLPDAELSFGDRRLDVRIPQDSMAENGAHRWARAFGFRVDELPPIGPDGSVMLTAQGWWEHRHVIVTALVWPFDRTPGRQS
jgi:hypothetical protein